MSWSLPPGQRKGRGGEKPFTHSLLPHQSILGERGNAERGLLRLRASAPVMSLGRGVIVVPVLVAHEDRFVETRIDTAAVQAPGSRRLQQRRARGHPAPVDGVAALHQFEPARLGGHIVDAQESQGPPGHRESGLVVEVRTLIVTMVGGEYPLRLTPLPEVVTVAKHAASVCPLPGPSGRRNSVRFSCPATGIRRPGWAAPCRWIPTEVRRQRQRESRHTDPGHRSRGVDEHLVEALWVWVNGILDDGERVVEVPRPLPDDVVVRKGVLQHQVQRRAVPVDAVVGLGVAADVLLRAYLGIVDEYLPLLERKGIGGGVEELERPVHRG